MKRYETGDYVVALDQGDDLVTRGGNDWGRGDRGTRFSLADARLWCQVHSSGRVKQIIEYVDNEGKGKTICVLETS